MKTNTSNTEQCKTAQDAIIESIKAACNGTVPAFYSEDDIDRMRLRSKSSLQRDRTIGGGMGYVKANGQIRYPLAEVIRFAIQNFYTATCQYTTPVDHQARLENLELARAAKTAKRNASNAAAK